MNRSWFRNPFGSSTAGSRLEEDELEAEQIISTSSSASKRKRRRNNKAGASDTSASTSYASSNGEASTFATNDAPPVPPLPSQSFTSTNHAHAPSLHSISSIRTAHFHSRMTTASPDGSTEASPSKTPLHDRLSRLSWASTASGMMQFGDEDMEEAERRWREEEEQRDLEDGIAQDGDFESRRDGSDSFAPASRLTPSRSSTSLKSILKKSIIAVENAGTPHRTVTWSPSTLPAATSPPEVDVTPEHPRLHTRLPVKVHEVSPLQHVYVADESLLGSDESREVEEALLSRTSISPTMSANASHNDAADSPNVESLASRKRDGFIEQMKAFIPSPDNSVVADMQARAKQAPETSNLLDMTEPSRLQEVTVTDERSRMKSSTGPRPFLLRQSVIMEDSSTLIASPPGSPDSTVQDFHSFATANMSQNAVGDSASLRSSVQQNLAFQSDRAAEVDDRSVRRAVGSVATLAQPSFSDSVPPTSQRLVALPTVTPSSSSSSVALRNRESPFSSLINRLLSTQDDLLSSRADQKTLLLSLVANLRGELAAKDRALDAAEQRKIAVYDQLRKAKEEREHDRQEQEQMLQEAVERMETAQLALSAEIVRRENALREEMLHEKTRREMAETQLDQLKRENASFEGTTQLRQRLQAQEAESQHLLQESIRAEREMQARHAEEANDLRTHLEAARSETQRLHEQLQAAEVHAAREAKRSEQHIASLGSQLQQATGRNGYLENQLQDTTHAFEHERFEQARQADYTASIQEDLQQEHDRLQRSVSRLQQDRDTIHLELVGMKADSTRLLQQRDERILQLEEEVLNRSAERHRSADTSCPECKEAESRTTFLESEIIRLREQVGKMRMESADREVKVARLAKTRDQLKEDIDGLNIALEAKQQEVRLLKRASTEIPGTIRKPLRSRPSSTHEAGKTATIQRLRADSHRYSMHNTSTLETPSIAATALSSAATSDRPTSILGARRPPSRTDNRALEAASLVPRSEHEKENVQRTLGKKITSLPDAPKHPISASPAKKDALHA